MKTSNRHTAVNNPSGETRYLKPKFCHLCTLTKLIPEHDQVCGDCWALRMVGRARVACPFYLFEGWDPRYTDGRVPIELCYGCAYRSGWTERLGPVCTHPIGVQISERWGVEVVRCPGRSALAGESLWVPSQACQRCPYYRGELVTKKGRFAYCSIPGEKLVGPASSERDQTRDQRRRDDSSRDQSSPVYTH